MAIEAITTYLNDRFGSMSPENEYQLTTHVIFSPHDIYSFVKETYSKQIIPSERREAICEALKYFTESKFLETVNYENCTTQYYKITAPLYLKLVEEFSKVNTNAEINTKISETELACLLCPYFKEYSTSENETDVESEPEQVTFNFDNPFTVKSKTIKLIDRFAYNFELTTPLSKISETDRKKGKILYHTLLKRLQKMSLPLQHKESDEENEVTANKAIDSFMSPDICRYLSFDFLCDILRSELPIFEYAQKERLRNLYMRYTNIPDNETLNATDKNKLSRSDIYYKPEVKREDYWTFVKRKEQEETEKAEKVKKECTEE